MNTSEQLQWLRRQMGIILLLTVIVAAASGVWTAFQPVTHKASLAFTVNRINKQDTLDYQYDGYYAIQASDLFSQTVVSWFLTPSFVLEVYDRAEVAPAIDSLEKFTSRFKTRKYSAQNIVVAFTERDEQTAEGISAAVVSLVEERAAELNQTSDRKALFEVVGSQPVIVEQRPSVVINSVIGLVAGLLIGFGFVYLRRYLTSEA